MPKVNILLSTYNGEAFLEQQLDSLQAQTYKNIEIYIRDDGSTDNTIEIIKRYEDRYENFRISFGNNIGATNSFFQLSVNCGAKDQLYAFCDQDDVWDSYKISRAVERIQNSPEPSMTLYFCRRKLVNQSLQPLGVSQSPSKINFASAIYDLPAYGCSSVFGNGIRKLFLEGDPNDMLGHDWWIYLIAIAFGHVIFDAEPLMQYRLHNANTSNPRVGSKNINIFFREFKFHVKDLVERIIRKDPSPVDFLAQAHRFIFTYYNVPLNVHEVVQDLVALKSHNQIFKRLFYKFNSKVYHSDPMSAAFLWLRFLLACH